MITNKQKTTEKNKRKVSFFYELNVINRLTRFHNRIHKKEEKRSFSHSIIDTAGTL
jgi:hypothetical protein